MKFAAKSALAILAVLAAGPALGQQAQPGIAPITFGDDPYVFDTAELHKIKVTVLAKGLPAPSRSSSCRTAICW